MKLQVLADGQIPVQAQVLLNHAKLRLHSGRVLCHIDAVDKNPSGRGLVRVVRMRMVVVLPLHLAPRSEEFSLSYLKIQVIYYLLPRVLLAQARISIFLLISISII